MKKRHLILIVSIFTILLLVSCNKNSTLKVNDTLTKPFEFEIDSLAESRDTELSFFVKKSQELKVNFSKGNFKDGIYTISSKQYLEDDKPVFIDISSEQNGTYNFEMIFKSGSDDLDLRYVNKEKIIDIPEFRVVSNFQYYLRFIILGTLLLIVLLGFLLWRYRAINYPKFDSGYINFLFPSGIDDIDLTGKNRIDLSEYSEDSNTKIEVFCSLEDGIKQPFIKTNNTSLLYENKEAINLNILKVSYNSDYTISNIDDIRQLTIKITE